MAPKAKSKMTWNRLKNDASIQKNELVRIAKAFGITPPKGWNVKPGTSTKATTGAQRSRTEGMAKPKPKTKAPAAKKAVAKEPAAISSVRQKAVAPKAKKAAAQKEPAAISSKRQRAVAPKAKSPTTRTRTSTRVYKTTSEKARRTKSTRGEPMFIPGRVTKRELISGGSLADVAKPKGARTRGGQAVRGVKKALSKRPNWRRLAPKGRMW